MNTRFICIHGHFYQPPRENPWLEDVEVEDSAAPYHDWNERITAECYEPNTVARILDGDERIVELLNNYQRISFNFGPTLLSWLERHRHQTYRQIIEADRASRLAHRGHSNAIAQCYNHVIMPLASEREKLTQVRWGIADFEFRFGHKPEGMWLPETAVDLATLQVLAEQGIRFTILSPHQAQAARAPGEDWRDVSDGRIDTTRPYRCRLREGRHIDLFFYNAAISHDIAFENMLRSGDGFTQRLVSAFDSEREDAQLVTVATDGETFGHHHKFGEMALAFALGKIERAGFAEITNYAEYLAMNPPEHEVRIREYTSWSCSHGVERWRSDCGCNSGNTHFLQRWRAPLRNVLDWLGSKLDIVFEHESSALIKDSWSALDDYVGVILDRSHENRERFLTKHAHRELSESEIINVWRLLEMQRHRALMYTSCGWFFDDVTNIETVKIIEYAARAIQLARQASGADLESQFLAQLANIPGNKPRFANGAEVYQALVRPSIASLKKGLAHYAISSLIEEYEPEQRIFSFEFERKSYRRESNSGRTLAVGSVNARSAITNEKFEGILVVLHLGGYDFHCIIGGRASAQDYKKLEEKLFRSFGEDSTLNLLQAIAGSLDGEAFALKDLFKDERRKIGRLLLRDAIERTRDHYQRIYEESRDVMRFLAGMKVPAPETLKRPVEYVLSQRLENACSGATREALRHSDFREVTTSILREAESLGCKVDVTSLNDVLERVVDSSLLAYQSNNDSRGVETALIVLRLVEQLGVDLRMWGLQNLFWEILTSKTPLNETDREPMLELAARLRFSDAVIKDVLPKSPHQGSAGPS